MIREWLKKGALILPLAVSAGCDYLTPQGMQVKQDADGIISAEEEAEVKTALESKEYVNDFLPFKPFVNDFNVYADNRFRAEGLPSIRFSDDLHISFVTDTAEYCDTNKAGVPSACSMDPNYTMYFKMDYFLPLYFLSTFHHEAGHQMRQGTYEFPSEAYKAYFLFSVYGFNKRIGSAFANLAFKVPKPLLNPDNNVNAWCQPVNEYLAGNYNKYYGYGDLGFLVMANHFNGNLEKALDKMLRAPQLFLEQAVRGVSSNYDNMCEAMLGEFEKLLQNHGFQDRLQERMSRDEMLEFVSYLNFIANVRIEYLMIPDGLMPIAEWRSRTISEGEDFISRFGNNPYFRAIAAYDVSEAYLSTADDILAGDALRSGRLWELHRIAKRVIEMNKDYPCAFDIYECPKLLSSIREDHVLAYLYATYFSAEMINAGIETHASLIAVPEDFASKFYASGNYHYEDNNRELAVHAPQVMFFAAGLEDSMASTALQYFDFGEGIRHLCKATGWYKKVLEAGCKRIPDAEKKAECESQTDASIEQAAEDKVSRRAHFYDANCI